MRRPCRRWPPTFTETFGHLYPPQDLQAFLEEAYTVERQRVILAHPDYAVWLLELDGEAVGHAAAGLWPAASGCETR